MAEVAEVHVYPVKSLQGISLESATLTPRGLENDRRWMIVDADGTFVTQRQLPEMAQIKVSINEERLTLSHVDSQPLELSLKGPISEPIQVKASGNSPKKSMPLMVANSRTK